MDAILNPIEPALISAVAKAIATLTAILDDAAAPAAQKIRAACTILRISMSWPKQREALLADVAPPFRAVSAPTSPNKAVAPTLPPLAQQSRAMTPAAPNPPIPSLAARLETLSIPLLAPLPQSFRATTLLASAGAAPLTTSHSALTRIAPVTVPLAKTG